MRRKDFFTYEIKNRNLHHTLIEVGRPVLDDLDSNHLLSLEILAFHDLSECTLAKNVQDQVSVPKTSISSRIDPRDTQHILMARLFRSQYIIDVEDIITIFIVITIILDTLAWLGENSAGIPRRFIFETWVANPVRRRQMCCQSLQRLIDTESVNVPAKPTP